MSKKTPVIVSLKKSKHKSQPWTFRVDMPGKQPDSTVSERYSRRDAAKRGALRMLRRLGATLTASPNGYEVDYTWRGRPIRFVGTLLAFLLSAALHAQTYDLQAWFGIDHTKTKTLSAAGYTYTAAKAKYGAGIGWLEYIGATQAEVMACYEAAIAHTTAIWLGDAYPIGTTNINYTNGCQSRATVIWPHGGNFRTTIPLLLAHGIVEGMGSSVYYDASGTTGGTGITVDHNAWLTRLFPDRFAMQSTTWGQGVEGQYAEGLVVRHLYLNGARRMQQHDPTYTSAGIAIAQAGSTSLVANIIADAFNTAGLLFTGGIPVSVRDCRTFYCGLAGILCRGTALSTIYLNAVEFDDCGTALLVDAGYGNAAGGTFVITGSKFENGKNKIGTSTRPMTLMDISGAFNVTVDGINTSVYAGKVDYAIRLNPQTFQASFSMRGFRHCGHPAASEYTYLLRDATHRWAMPAQCAPVGVEWTANGTMTATRTLARTTAAMDPDPDPHPLLYRVDFGATGSLNQLPGCNPAQPQYRGSLKSGKLVTNTYTTHRFAAPIEGVASITYRSLMLKDDRDRDLSDALSAMAGWIRYSPPPWNGLRVQTYTRGKVADVTVTLPALTTLKYLVGDGTFRTMPMEVAAIEVYGGPDPQAP